MPSHSEVTGTLHHIVDKFQSQSIVHAISSLVLDAGPVKAVRVGRAVLRAEKEEKERRMSAEKPPPVPFAGVVAVCVGVNGSVALGMAGIARLVEVVREITAPK